MKKGEPKQEQRKDEKSRHDILETHGVEKRGEDPLRKDHHQQTVNVPISERNVERIDRRTGDLETGIERGLISTGHVKRKHTKHSTQTSKHPVRDVTQIPSTSTSSDLVTSAKGKDISRTVQYQSEIASPTDSPLYKRHKTLSDKTSTSKPAIEISSSSDTASSPEGQKSTSPELTTSPAAHFDDEMEEVTEDSEKLRKEVSTERQQLDTLRTGPPLPVQEASSSGSSRKTSGTSHKSTSSVPEKLTCRLPINESTRAALTLYILGNRNVKEDEESSDILDPVEINNPVEENLKCRQIIRSSMPFDIPVIEDTVRSVDSELMPPPKTKIKDFTPPSKVRNKTPKEEEPRSRTWWCVDSVTFFPSDQLHHRFRSSRITNRTNWNITSYPRNIQSNRPSNLQLASGSYNLRTKPPEVEPAEEDEEFVGRPSTNGTSKRILGLVPHIGNITLTSVLWTKPDSNEIFCRGIKRCQTCGMPQGLFTRLPITVKLLWYNSLDDKQVPHTDTIECAFPVDIWGTAALLKRQDSSVGWILDSKILDVDLLLLKYAKAQDYGSEIPDSKSARGESFERRTSDSESSEDESSES